jgi:hypothetical protein
MSSGAQAQIAASQAATEAQAEAARNALAFSKEQFEYMKGLRRPYTDAGASATQMLMNLLGLTPGLVQGGGGAGGGGVIGGGGSGSGAGSGAGAGSGSGAGSGTGSGSGSGTGSGTGSSSGAGTGTGTGTGDGEKFPGYKPPPYKPGPPGTEHPLPGDQPIIPNPNTFSSGADPADLPPLVPTTPVINPAYLPPGPNTKTGMADVFDPATGTKRTIPSSLVSFYTAKGWTV